ncbi:MAG: hypothetical protein JXR94_16670 [Candidatus Hydrogenedentes bacterium]|nr:hypothetical protein [Candidatus Hydrogenedentota bacterium]
MAQLDIFDTPDVPVRLPVTHAPECPPHVHVERIILTRGSRDSPERRAFIRHICGGLPGVPVEERLDTPHNQIDLRVRGAVPLQAAGKRTLVFGVLKNAVRFSQESGNTCPNYWHFSLYGHCPYGCSYCYLAGTQGVWFSPTVKIYVNLPEIIARMDRIANELTRPVSFYHGKLQDPLALDPLTGYSSVLIPFFARHRYARHVQLTKSASVERLLDLEHGGHTILSWSLNPPAIARRFESTVPSVEMRLRAMEQCAAAGYPVRAVVMPIVPVDDWPDVYAAFLRHLVERVPLQRLTLGGICSYTHALHLTRQRLGDDNVVSRHLAPGSSGDDGRARYEPGLRVRIYNHLIDAARAVRPDLPVALCLEERGVWRQVHAHRPLGPCNCIL